MKQKELAQRISWAPRVSQAAVKRLYESVAQGLFDEDFIDKVGYALYARCESFVDAIDARNGFVPCPECRTVIRHQHKLHEVLLCPECGWKCTWRVYHKSMQHKQLSGNEEVVDLFRRYMDRFSRARTAREKVVEIDFIIHGFHWDLKTGPRRPTAANLIGGRTQQLIEFLDGLTYGEEGPPELRETARAWRKGVRQAFDRHWGTEPRLHHEED